MKEDNFNKKYNKAAKYSSLAQDLIGKLAKEIAKDKGFKHWDLFEASFATGNETVVMFNGQGEFADLDLRVMFCMTKEEIIKKFEHWEHGVPAEDIELLKEE